VLSTAPRKKAAFASTCPAGITVIEPFFSHIFSKISQSNSVDTPGRIYQAAILSS